MTHDSLFPFSAALVNAHNFPFSERVRRKGGRLATGTSTDGTNMLREVPPIRPWLRKLIMRVSERSRVAMRWHLDITGAHNGSSYPLCLGAEMILQLKRYSLNSLN